MKVTDVLGELCRARALPRAVQALEDDEGRPSEHHAASLVPAGIQRRRSGSCAAASSLSSRRSLGWRPSVSRKRLGEPGHRAPVFDVERARPEDHGHRAATVPEAPVVAIALKRRSAKQQERERLDDGDLALEAPGNARLERLHGLQRQAEDQRHLVGDAAGPHPRERGVHPADLVAPLDHAPLLGVDRLESELEADVQGRRRVQERVIHCLGATLERQPPRKAVAHEALEDTHSVRRHVEDGVKDGDLAHARPAEQVDLGLDARQAQGTPPQPRARLAVLAERAAEWAAALSLPPDERPVGERDGPRQPRRWKRLEVNRRLREGVRRPCPVDAGDRLRPRRRRERRQRLLAIPTDKGVDVGIDALQAPPAVGDLRPAEDQPAPEARAPQSTEHVLQKRLSPHVGPERHIGLGRRNPLRLLEDGGGDPGRVEARLIDGDDDGADVEPTPLAQRGEDGRVAQGNARVLVARPVEIDENDAAVHRASSARAVAMTETALGSGCGHRAGEMDGATSSNGSVVRIGCRRASTSRRG